MKMQHRKIEENGKNSRTSSNMTNMQLTERKELFGHKCYRTWKKVQKKERDREKGKKVDNKMRTNSRKIKLKFVEVESKR